MKPRKSFARLSTQIHLDPDRWIVLVQFLTLTKQLEKAEKAVHDAESALKEKPLGLLSAARCWDEAYKTAGQGPEIQVLARLEQAAGTERLGTPSPRTSL